MRNKNIAINSECKEKLNNKMMLRASTKGLSMEKENTDMKVILQFPETSDDSECIIDEVRTVLLDIFQNNMREQLTTSPIRNTI